MNYIPEKCHSSEYKEEDLRVLAERIYELDTKVYEHLGSSQGQRAVRRRACLGDACPQSGAYRAQRPCPDQ